jgi:ubiquitin-conjugating enzyme E2 Q
MRQNSISAVLLQIRLAISNLDPRPARLAQNWQLSVPLYSIDIFADVVDARPYTPTEALQGFQRAAATHNWKVPASLTKMIR